MNQKTGVVRNLGYPQAAVWDLINRGYSYDQTIHMLCSIASMKPEETEQLLLESLDEWAESGFLIKEKAHG
jgi:hypothetical protein